VGAGREGTGALKPPGDESVSIAINVQNTVVITAGTFLAHGWEPWTATQAFVHFDNPVLVKTMSHLRGQTIRFGGISADWLDYVVSDAMTPACEWARPEGRPFTAGGQCPFSTGALDRLLDFVADAGVELLFDLNELIGRNCTEAGKRGKGEWCGDAPSPWDTRPVLKLLQHIERRNESGQAVPIGFELGNVRNDARSSTAMSTITVLTISVCLSSWSMPGAFCASASSTEHRSGRHQDASCDDATSLGRTKSSTAVLCVRY
jgi:hypothetical protein